MFRSSGFFSRVNGTKGTVPQSPWSLFPSSSSILQNFVHLCCIGLTSGSTYSWLHSSQLCRQRHSVHSVLLIVQPQECADDAGFTLVQSHCRTLPSGPVSLSCSPSAIFTPQTFLKFVSYANFFSYDNTHTSRSVIQRKKGSATTPKTVQ